jgi:hypothetical protein
MKTILTTALSAASLAVIGSVAGAQCYEVQDQGQSFVPLENYPVAELAAEPGLIPVPELSDEANAILCERDTVVPDENDFELIRYRGVPLMLRDGEGEDATTLLLYFQRETQNEDGTVNPPQYGVQLPQGELSDEDRTLIVAAIEGFAESEDALQAYMNEQSQAEEG